jgi:hypothetical protein
MPFAAKDRLAAARTGGDDMRPIRLAVGAATLTVAAWAAPVSADAVTDWNVLATQCIALTPSPAPAGRPGPAQFLDTALVQVAVHDAIQAIEGRYAPYRAEPPATGDESPAAAAAAAAYRVLL